MWNLSIIDNCKVYNNEDIDLKVKTIEENDRVAMYINYKGYNVTIPMLVWEFGEDLNLASIEDVSVEGTDRFDKHFVVNKRDEEKFLDEVYFFLTDNKIDSVLDEDYRVCW